MKIIDKINMFIKNMTRSNSKAKEPPSFALNICDIPIQQDSFSNVSEEDKLVVESQPLKNEQPTRGFSNNASGNEYEQMNFETQINKSTSLLDNFAYMSLAQQCCDILMELDKMNNQIKNEDVLDFIAQQKSRIREALILSGASLIAEETKFNMLRHKCINGGVVKNGTPIVETIEAGVEIEGRVMNKCLVVV